MHFWKPSTFPWGLMHNDADTRLPWNVFWLMSAGVAVFEDFAMQPGAGMMHAYPPGVASSGM